MSGEIPSSLWIATTPGTDYPPLEPGIDVDVAVVGAGIAGITTAFLLKRAGKTVALIESKRILRGATGYTTAKVTAGHSLTYAHVEQHFGAEGARLYAEANSAAIERIAELCEQEGIDCELERKANYVYSEGGPDLESVREEAEAARRAGLPASFVTELPLPYPVAGAFRLENQAQFHPRKYLLPLAAAIPGGGSHVFELTRATHVSGDGLLRVRTDRGELRARDVVVATHLPFLDRGLFFAKAHPSRSYAVAARVDEERAPDGMFINTSSPTRSIRTARDEHGLLLILGGEGHKPGDHPDTERHYRALEEFGRRWFGAEEFPYRWATQDYTPVDQVPYVGRLTPTSRHVWVATGFKKWGMTSGTVAAMILSDAILSRPNRWAQLFDAQRLKPRPSARKFLQENASAALHFVRDRLQRGDEATVDEVGPGEGRMLKLGGQKMAVYRDEAGVVHTLSPVCRHMGCHVAWNSAERTWDCPCHGSRYSGEGRVVQGPAVDDLTRR